jgi:hypothetical protein
VSTLVAPTTRTISAAQAVTIAEADAIQAYGDLSLYRIEATPTPDGWKVCYLLFQPRMAGGGPHYLIDATTGAILDKKYYQ